MKRRNFIALVGGGIVLAAGATLGTVATRYPEKALKPWADAGSLYSEPRKKALSYAILAPNPHNRQPWMVDLTIPDHVVLKVDTDRLLPHTDPFSRQITIGLGCFLELLVMAAAEDGYRVDLSIFPEGESQNALDGRPVAIARFSPDANVKPDPLFAHVLDRRSLKEPYDISKPVSEDTLEWVKRAATHGNTIGTSNEPAHVEKLRKLTHDALIIETITPRTFKESVDLFRIGKKEVEANPDGIDFSGPFFETLHFVGGFHREGTLDASSSMFKEGMKAVLAQADTAMAHLWLVTDGNSRADQISAGRDWVRLNLATTAEGVGIQPLSQALQEYPEMADLYNQVHTLFAKDGGTVQMLGRLGYADEVRASPRWPLEAKIIKG